MGFAMGNFSPNILPNRIKTAIGETTPIYGVKFDGTNSAGVRTYDAAELRWEPSTNTYAGLDDFRNLAPFNTKECVTTYNSTTGKREVLGYKGDSGYDSLRANTNYDIMIEVPCFWYKRPSRYEWIVSPEYREGFLPSPAHYRKGILYDSIRVSKYNLNNDYISQIGSSPKVSTNMNTFRSNLRNKGMYLIDYPTWCSLVMLMMVKYANMNVQATVGYGRAEANSTVVSGRTDSILGVDGSATGLGADESVLTLGIENLYSNTWKYIDGLYSYNYELYIKDVEDITSDPSESSDLSTYTKLTTAVPSGDRSPIRDIVYDNNYPYMIYPIFTGNPSPSGDNMWSASGLDCIMIGGGGWSGASCGLFTFHANHAVGFTDIDNGSVGIEFA